MVRVSRLVPIALTWARARRVRRRFFWVCVPDHHTSSGIAFRDSPPIQVAIGTEARAAAAGRYWAPTTTAWWSGVIDRAAGRERRSAVYHIARLSSTTRFSAAGTVAFLATGGAREGPGYIDFCPGVTLELARHLGHTIVNARPPEAHGGLHARPTSSSRTGFKFLLRRFAACRRRDRLRHTRAKTLEAASGLIWYGADSQGALLGALPEGRSSSRFSLTLQISSNQASEGERFTRGRPSLPSQAQRLRRDDGRASDAQFRWPARGPEAPSDGGVQQAIRARPRGRVIDTSWHRLDPDRTRQGAGADGEGRDLLSRNGNERFTF